MSTQRSPPASNLHRLLSAPAASTHYSSDPVLNTSSDFDPNENKFSTAKRHKRTFGDVETQPMTSTSEVKALFIEHQNQQDLKFETLSAALNTIVSQNQDIIKSMSSMTEQHKELLQKVNTLEQENTKYKSRIADLETKLDLLEKNVRSTTIEIRNIPKIENETKQYLSSIVQKIGASLGLEQIQKPEIKDIYRSKSNAIVVDLNSTQRKESIIATLKNTNKSRRESKKPSLNTEDIKVAGLPQTIYISEYLTSKNRRLFYVARENVKSKKFFAAWTAYGKVYVKTKEGTAPVRIEEESDLLNLT